MIKKAVESGSNLLNGSEFYGPSLQDNSLTLLKEYFEKYPEDAEKYVPPDTVTDIVQSPIL